MNFRRKSVGEIHGICGTKSERLKEALIKHNGKVNKFNLWEVHLYGDDVNEAVKDLILETGMKIERIEMS